MAEYIPSKEACSICRINASTVWLPCKHQFCNSCFGCPEETGDSRCPLQIDVRKWRRPGSRVTLSMKNEEPKNEQELTRYENKLAEFENYDEWTIDSRIACLAAAKAVETITPGGIVFVYSRNGRTELPTESLCEIFQSFTSTVTIRVLCGDSFHGEEIKTRGGRDRLFELIDLYRFVKKLNVNN